MSSVDSTASQSTGKPSKPYPEFPLFPHAAGVWAKKIRGKLCYFGPWASPDAALRKYLAAKDALHAGRTPRPDPEAITIKDVANGFLGAKQALLEAGELSPRTWHDYKTICDLVVAHFGKARLASDVHPDDFALLRNKMAKRWGAQRLGSKLIQYTCSLFKYAYDSGMISVPVRFGPGFKRPSKKVIRLNRAGQGPKLFTREEIRRLVDASGAQLRAMLLLGINCGFNNSDCGNLPLTALDLERGWVDYPRPKTGIARRCPLWPETIQAMKEAIAARPEPKCEEDAALVFVTKYGGSWCKDTSTNPISQETGKLLKRLAISGRKGRGFATLRHVFRTIADETEKQPAVDHIMGHESAHMSSHYRERISDERLLAVTDYVRRWLFGS